MGYVTGKGGANAICDICGFEYKNFELRKNWKNQMVCSEDYETRHPMDLIRPPKPEKPLSWTRPEAPDTYGSFLTETLHTNISSTTPVVTTATTRQYGLKFTANVNGYITGAHIFHGGLSENKATYFNEQYPLSIWNSDTAARLYLAPINHLVPGRWNFVPVTPSVPVVATTNYVISLFKETGQPRTDLNPIPAISARPLATYVSSVLDASLSTLPAVVDPDNLPLFDVIIIES